MPVTALARSVPLSHEPVIARRQVSELLAEAGWSGNVDEILLALHEAIINAHSHAGGIDRVTAGFDRGSFVVEVWDRGKGFRLPRSVSLPPELAEHGRGLFLMRRLASHVEVCRSGGAVGLQLRFDP